MSTLPSPRPWAAGSMPTTYTSPSSGLCRLVQWKPSRPAAGVRDQEAVRVEPVLAHPLGEPAASIAPCSGCCANAAALTRTTSAASSGR